jgi:hypothetical protein
VRTRFFIWNCPDTNRQFIADCNINLATGTPQRFLQAQFDATRTMACHPGASASHHDGLPQRVHFAGYGIEFFIPATWRTAEFSYAKWYKDGPTPSNGSLWTLPTDSEKIVHIRRIPSDQSVSADMLRALCNWLTGQSLRTPPGTGEITNIRMDNPRQLGGRWAGDVTMSIRFTTGDNEELTTFRCRGLAWRQNGDTWFLLAGLGVTDKIWGMPVDLAPVDETLDTFVFRQVLPALRLSN